MSHAPPDPGNRCISRLRCPHVLFRLPNRSTSAAPRKPISTRPCCNRPITSSICPHCVAARRFGGSPIVYRSSLEGLSRMIPFSKRPIARGACVRRATRNASIGSRIPTNTSSPSRISRAAAATINSLKVKPRAALSASVRVRTLFHAPLLLDPLRLGDLNFVDELDVLSLRNRLFHVLREFFGTQQFASDAVWLIREFANVPIELHIRHIQRRLASGNMPVDLLDQLLALEMVELAIVLVHVAEVGFLMGL